MIPRIVGNVPFSLPRDPSSLSEEEYKKRLLMAKQFLDQPVTGGAIDWTPEQLSLVKTELQKFG